jgi:hypothetical protein
MFAFRQEVPIGMDVYRLIREELGEVPPPGLVVHVVEEIPQGLRYLDVWETEAQHRTFVEERLHPAVHKAFQRAGRTFPRQEPGRQDAVVTEVWTRQAGLARG